VSVVGGWQAPNAGEECGDLGIEDWNFFLRSDSDAVEIHSKIIVDQFVAHSGNVTSGNIRVGIAEVG
jgi:hypothetical protein